MAQPVQAASLDSPHTDGQMASQFERVIRRVKISMNYRGSYDTRDILGSLVARWLQSGEWERLQQLPPDERQRARQLRLGLGERVVEHDHRRRAERERQQH